MTDWIVILEFSPAAGERFDLATVQTVVECLREWHPIGLFHPDRYAVQLQVPADGPDDALRAGTACCRPAILDAAGGADLIRAEVMTVAEFESTWQGGGSRRPAEAPPGEDFISYEVYEATRALVGATVSAEVTEALVDFVLAIGGDVQLGPHGHDPAAVCVDLALEPGQELFATAEAFSVSGMIIERWLPQLVNDARRAQLLLERR